MNANTRKQFKWGILFYFASIAGMGFVQYNSLSNYKDRIVALEDEVNKIRKIIEVTGLSKQFTWEEYTKAGRYTHSEYRSLDYYSNSIEDLNKRVELIMDEFGIEYIPRKVKVDTTIVEAKIVNSHKPLLRTDTLRVVLTPIKKK